MKETTAGGNDEPFNPGTAASSVKEKKQAAVIWSGLMLQQKEVGQLIIYVYNRQPLSSSFFYFYWLTADIGSTVTRKLLPLQGTLRCRR